MNPIDLIQMKNIFLILLFTQWAWASFAQTCPPTETVAAASTGSRLVQAAQTVTAAATITVSGTDSVVYRAGQSVTLNPGFESFITGNARFKAEIGSCLPTTATTHSYRMDTLRLNCGTSNGGCTPVFLTAPVTNATGWTLEVDFDPTKVTPTTHTLGSMVTNGAMSAFVSNGKLILSIFLTGAANINGNAGDMLVCLGWANVGSVSNTVANLSGIVETSTVTSTTTTTINSRIAITGGNAVNFWVYYGSTAIPFSVAANPTQIYSGSQANGMSYKGNVSNAGLYLLNLNTDSLVQFNRQSLSGRGAPVIGGFDGALVFKIIARDPAYQPTAAAIMASDVDGDGRITAADITYIQRRAVGIYPTGFPQFGTGMIVSNRHFPKAWLTSRPDYRLSTRYPVGDGVGCSRELVPKIDSLFTIDNFYRMRCDTAIMDISMLLLGDVDGNYLPTGGHQFGRQNVATMNYEICDNWSYNIRNNILYIKVYADKNLTGGDWIIENSALTLLGAEVVNANTTLLTTHLVGNNLSITASATSGDIPAGTPIFYLKVPASEQDRIKTLADLGTLTGYHNASVAEHVVRYCRVPTKEVDKSSIHFYPNPTADGLITIEHLDKTPDKILVYNSLGQIILHDIAPTGQTTPLDLSGFAKGVYHVKVDHQMYKVVKQ
ncbi:MAG: Secretion system C-terminal sorting domain [Bacteroidota bacterium]